MTQGERVRELRKSLKLTLEKFGDKLGVKKSAISDIELGRNSLTDQMSKAICREYNVNYDWLMNGEGEMFSDLPLTVLDELCKQYDCDDLDRSMIQEYLKLDTESRKILKDYIRNVFNSGKDGR